MVVYGGWPLPVKSMSLGKLAQALTAAGHHSLWRHLSERIIPAGPVTPTFPAGRPRSTTFTNTLFEWSNTIRCMLEASNWARQATSWWSSSNPTNTNIRNPYPSASPDQLVSAIITNLRWVETGGNPIGTTVFLVSMQVDYVRA